MNTDKPTLLFVNLPVSSVDTTRAFFTGLGFTFNTMFCDENSLCMELNPMASVMFLQRRRFSDFTPKTVADAHHASEVLMCISRESRAAVDELTQRALELGATEAREPQDHGFMYGRSINDPDGHIWEIMWMDMAQFPGNSAAAKEGESTTG
ncbi:VOC family protein [Advenella mimigardefordensis]|uniref:Glyoxalase-like domain-containing protein n=1 Tax=Advenella mimigardefordensis (strain DSM 17166 / LMG 22922 / DPN7) TaxID=1247726 RepID=W0PHU9_ADVMD|nr:VOC family protein [Advenella mimigardefordensis]AHG66071.1 glyoxalase-like domain-containing protein [Advenella mimigardefordensis DPN7]